MLRQLRKENNNQNKNFDLLSNIHSDSRENDDSEINQELIKK